LNFDSSYNFEYFNNFNIEDTVKDTSNLLTFGWKKEAIPISQSKKSIITRIFKSIFG